MSVIVNNIKLSPNKRESNLLKKAASLLGLEEVDVSEWHIRKKSLDARNKNNPMFVYSVLLELKTDEKLAVKNANNNNVKLFLKEELIANIGQKPLDTPVYVVGLGPAGLFCGYLLAKYGYKPVIVERGYDIDRRVLAIENFFSNAVLDEKSNVQFGEGGAGTFSDGKLTTRISDKHCDFVLETLVKFGAPDEILYKAKPHVGTDKLRDVIKNIRKEIINLGGEVHFDHKLENIIVDNSKIKGIVVNSDEVATDNVVLALGHSARDTFEMLLNKGVFLEAKSFSVGARIEHLQSDINESLYRLDADKLKLPQGEYQLSYRENDRGVYTFCMCPGGVVVPSSSSAGSVVTNGMSEYARDNVNANAAVVVSVTPNDFGNSPLDGVRFQEQIEKKAFSLAGGDYKACAVTVGNFLDGKIGLDINKVKPSYSIGVSEADFNEILPEFVTDMMRKGINNFSKKMRAFSKKDAVLTAPETRTSSPVRIVRGENGMATNLEGLYPCGEGAGYAGGIMSAAVDGIKTALKIMEMYKPY